jgi:integrase
MAKDVHYLNPEQLRKLLRVAENRPEASRNIAMILLSYRHGLRGSEVCGIKLSDIDESNGLLTVRARKTRRRGGIKFSEAFRPKDAYGASDLAAIRSYMRERDEYDHAAMCDFLFLSRKGGGFLAHSWTTAFKNLAKAAGLPSVLAHPHVLRHTAAMRAIDAGTPLHLVQGVLRHASIASLTPYIEPMQKDVDAAMIKALAKS